MKHTIFFTALLSIVISGEASAQSNSIQASAISFGGGLDSSANFAGSVTIGLPFVALTSDASGDTARLGMYFDTSSVFYPMNVVTTTPIVIEYQIFPNPSTGEFTIVPSANEGAISHIDLLNEAGQVVADLTHSMESDADGIHITSSGLASGTYFVRVEAKTGEYLYKFVIDHGVK